MVMYCGTGNTVAGMLERVTTAPPAGAGPDNVTVSCVYPPLLTVDGLAVRELSPPLVVEVEKLDCTDQSPRSCPPAWTSQ
jgi:hypothetical protein